MLHRCDEWQSWVIILSHSQERYERLLEPVSFYWNKTCPTWPTILYFFTNRILSLLHRWQKWMIASGWNFHWVRVNIKIFLLMFLYNSCEGFNLLNGKSFKTMWSTWTGSDLLTDRGGLKSNCSSCSALIEWNFSYCQWADPKHADVSYIIGLLLPCCVTLQQWKQLIFTSPMLHRRN